MAEQKIEIQFDNLLGDGKIFKVDALSLSIINPGNLAISSVVDRSKLVKDSTLSFTRRQDEYSVYFLQRASDGRRIAAGRAIYVISQGKTILRKMRLELEKMTIDNYSVAGGFGDPFEMVTVSFEKATKWE